MVADRENPEWTDEDFARALHFSAVSAEKAIRSFNAERDQPKDQGDKTGRDET